MENRISTAERLREIMQNRNLRQIDIVNLCEPYARKYRTKIGRNDISQYVAGKVEPGQTKLFILAKALDVSEAWLMGYNVAQHNNIFPIKTKQIPLLGEIACGQPIYAAEDRESYVMAGTDINADFCLVAKGDSMTGARILDGDIVFIRKQDMVDNGEIAAVVIGDEATLKRVNYYPEKNLLILKAENPLYPDQIYAEDQLDTVKVLGKAVAFQSDVR